MELPEKPPISISVGDRNIKMTYGMEMDIRRMLPDPSSAITLITHDPITQDYITRRLLTDKKAMIFDVEDLISAEDIDLDSEQVEALLMWAAEHALYFFVKRTSEMAKLGDRYKTALSTPTPNGSTDSPLTTPSVGLSE